MFFGRQREGVEIKVVWRCGIDFDDLAVHDEFNLRDFGLSASVDRDDFGVNNIFLRRRLKVIGDARRQGGDFKFGLQPADIALDILDRDFQLVFARLPLLRLDGISLIGRDDFAIHREFDAFDILVSADLDRDLRVLAQRLGEDVLGQVEQRHRNRRAQGGCPGCRRAVSGCDV